MIIRFSKYQGTGNDFIMIDNRSSVLRNLENTSSLIARLCNRKFGIGADGLILVNSSTASDFEMSYYNADGKIGTMCGNGGRSCVAFANSLGLIKESAVFTASDGLHEAFIVNKEKEQTLVKLKMKDVEGIIKNEDYFVLNTGSPHYVCFKKEVEKLNVFQEGRNIRYSKLFEKEGINVNFAEVKENGIFVRTYERGVEDETLSCGTGATAVAITASIAHFCKPHFCQIIALGGKLEVSFKQQNENLFTDIWLQGPVSCVYKGEINI